MVSDDKLSGTGCVWFETFYSVLRFFRCCLRNAVKFDPDIGEHLHLFVRAVDILGEMLEVHTKGFVLVLR